MAKDPAEIFTAQSILAAFEDLPDPRSDVNRVHLLGDIIVISVMAVIAGAEGPKAIGVWAKSNESWLREKLQLPGGIPSHDTIGRVLIALKPSAFQKCFQNWLASISLLQSDSDHDVIAIDGKALRRSHDHKRGLGPLFMVSAWAVQRGISLGQLATAEKSNEITAIPELLSQIDIESSVVTIHATRQVAKSRLRRRSLQGAATMFWLSKAIKETSIKQLWTTSSLKWKTVLSM